MKTSQAFQWGFVPFSFFDWNEREKWRRGLGDEESPNFHMLKNSENAQIPTEILATQANNLTSEMELITVYFQLANPSLNSYNCCC